MQDAGWFWAHIPGQGATRLAPRTASGLLPRGSLMLEFSLMAGESGALPLLHMGSREGYLRFFSIVLDGEGHLQLVQRQGKAVHALTLDLAGECALGGRMRLLFTWDCEASESRLSVEGLDSGSLRQRVAHGPLPMNRADLTLLAEAAAGVQIGPRVDWLALGDHVQPVGPGACFAPSTPLATPQGPRPAGSLRKGDLVDTVDAGPQPVLWSGRISFPALGALRPVRLCAPTFGATRDLWLWAQHRIALEGPAVDYLFGEDEVLVAARYLVDGCSAQQPDRPCVLAWQGILLEGHHLLIADGCRVESLSLGRLGRNPALVRSTVLAGLAEARSLPLHLAPVRRALLPYEAQALAGARSRARGPIAA